MKTWKLVSGTLSIVFAAFIIFQSSFAGLANALEENGGNSGTMGAFVAVLILTGGILSIATRNYVTNGGDIAIIVVNCLAALIGFTMHGNFGDLVIWAIWGCICAVLAVISLINKSKAKKAPDLSGK